MNEESQECPGDERRTAVQNDRTSGRLHSPDPHLAYVPSGRT